MVANCIRYYPGGIDNLVNEFQSHLENRLVQGALAKVAEKFASPEHVGPNHVADFSDSDDLDERSQLQRDVFEHVNALIERLIGGA